MVVTNIGQTEGTNGVPSLIEGKHVMASYEEIERSAEGFSTTFWMDFSIADRFGMAAVKDTYDRAFTEWRTDVRYLADLVVVLNHKIWQHYKTNEPLARLYDRLWREANDWAWENLSEAEQTYYYRVTD